MSYRLYLVNTKGKCTGKKRDYPSLEHFRKYGIETYERYNRSHYYTGYPTDLRAKLCFLNESLKWEELLGSDLEKILGKIKKI